jgi:NADH dehydrogenase FAD-containing subunit
VELASELSKRILANAEKRKIDGQIASKPKTITILEAGDRLLPKLKESTSEVITRHLVDKQHVEIVTSANIQEVSGDKIRLMRDGKQVELKSVIAVWTCGVKPDELAVRLVGHNKVLNRLQLTSNASVPAGMERAHNIFAIGDCNNLLPKSAQHSKQQGKYLAEQFNSDFKGDPSDVKTHFRFNPQGSMIRLSDRVFMDCPVYTGMLPLWVHHAIIGMDL